MNGVECKAYLVHENGRWAIYLAAPDWLCIDLRVELDGHVFVDIAQFDAPESSTIQFVQMPLGAESAKCDNCGNVVSLPKVDPPQTFKDRIYAAWRTLVSPKV